MPRRLPEEYVDRVDEARWGKPFDVNNEKNHTSKIVTGYILYRLTLYQAEEYDDYNLWTCFQEDFQDWTKEIFALGDADDVRKLRNHLRAYGVFVSKDGKRIAENLANAVIETEYHEWTEEEANDQLKIFKIFHSQWNPTTDEYKAPMPKLNYTPSRQASYQGSEQSYPALLQHIPQLDPHRRDNLHSSRPSPNLPHIQL